MGYDWGSDHHGRRYGTDTTRQRPHNRGGASSDPAESSEHSEAGEALCAKPEDGGEVEETDAETRCPYGPEAPMLHNPDAGARSANWGNGRDGAMRHNADRNLLKTQILESTPPPQQSIPCGVGHGSEIQLVAN